MGSGRKSSGCSLLHTPPTVLLPFADAFASSARVSTRENGRPNLLPNENKRPPKSSSCGSATNASLPGSLAVTTRQCWRQRQTTNVAMRQCWWQMPTTNLVMRRPHGLRSRPSHLSRSAVNTRMRCGPPCPLQALLQTSDPTTR